MTNYEKMLIASEALQQFCSDDAQEELNSYNLKHNTRLAFEDDPEDIAPFYVDLYNKGLRL